MKKRKEKKEEKEREERKEKKEEREREEREREEKIWEGIVIMSDNGLKWPGKLSGTIGKPLSSIALASYSTAGGCFSWKAPDEIISDDVHGIGVYWLTFTPTGAERYTEEMAVVVTPVLN